MDVRVVKQQIKDKNLGKFYIFCGDEIALQNIYIHKMCEVNNSVMQRIDSVSEIYSTRHGKSLVSVKYCYVVRDDKDFMKNERGWSTITQILGNNMLIFLVTQPDKRSKFYKHFKDDMVEFNHLELPVLIRYIQKDIDLSDKCASYLAELCERDYSRILLEVDKIRQYQSSSKDESGSTYTTDHCFEYLINTGVIYQPPKDAIFDLVDAILQRKPKLSFSLYEDCKNIGEASLVIESVLYNQLKHLLQVQSCESNDISKSTGLSGWDIKLVKDKVGRYTTRELVNALRLLRKVEKGIKIGDIEDNVSIDYILVNIL